MKKVVFLLCLGLVSCKAVNLPLTTLDDVMTSSATERIITKQGDTVILLKPGFDADFAKMGTLYGYWDSQADTFLTPGAWHQKHPNRRPPLAAEPVSFDGFHVGLVSSDGRTFLEPRKEWNTVASFSTEDSLARVTSYLFPIGFYSLAVRMAYLNTFMGGNNMGFPFRPGWTRSGIINLRGEYVVPMEYDLLDPGFSDGVIRFNRRAQHVNPKESLSGPMKAGLMSKQGEIVVKPGKYRISMSLKDQYYNLSSSYFCVCKGRRYGIIDNTGKLITEWTRAKNMDDYIAQNHVADFLHEYDAKK